MDRGNEMKIELIEKAKEFGLLNLKPEGEEFLKIVEELSKRNQSLALSLVANSMFLVEFEEWGSAETLHAFAITEPKSGSDLKACRTKLNDGKVYGVKTLVTNAELAESFAVLASESGRLKLCVVRRDDKVKVRKLNVSSFRGSGIGVVKFDGAEAEDVKEEGTKAVMRTLTYSRPFFSAIALGMSERCLEVAINYAKRRRAFGKSVLEFQGVSFQLAECVTEVEALRCLISEALRKREHLSAVCKLFAAKTVKKVTDVCLQVLAGHGLIRGGYVERAYRDAKAFDVGEGTSEIMKLLISRRF